MAPWEFDGPDADRLVWYNLTLVMMNAESEATRIRQNFQANWKTKSHG